MAATPATPKTADLMMEACSRFLESLSPDQKATATYPYLDGERIFWYYPPMNRHGLSLRDMNTRQRDLAHAVLASGLTVESYEQARQIMALEDVLGPLEKERSQVTWARDTELYYFTVFGQPNDKDPWGWRAEGHHLSLHFSVWRNEVISMTPFFFGANPAEVRKGPKKGLRILGNREDLAFTLMESLTPSQQSRALIHDKAPYDILTSNSSRASLPGEEGLVASRMSQTQREILKALVTEYINQVPSDLAKRKLAKLDEGGFDCLHLAWAGPVKKGEKHYYRVHGGNFIIEFDNFQNEANHIHSVLRDVGNDFATDVLAKHLLLYHVL